MKIKTYLSTTILLLLFSKNLLGQYNTNENKVWAFSIFVGLDFNSGTALPFTTSMQANEGCASVCNSAGGLLFYTEGVTVYNKLGAIMPSGLGIVPFGTSSTTQGVLIVPLPGSTTIYYVFSIEYSAGNISAPPIGKFAYSIVDMSLDGGLGAVTTAGIPIANNLSEKMIAIRGNNCNIWVLTHSKDSAIFRAYEITSAGINLTPVVSSVGSFSGTDSYSAGVMKISHDRLKLAVQCIRANSSFVRGTELYDFNPTTGVVSNCRVLETVRNGYGAEFSPDNSKLYSSEYSPGFNYVAQYDISLPTTAAIVASKVTLSTAAIPTQAIIGDMKLAYDNKIYRISDDLPPYINRFIDVINFPNNPGSSCGFVAKALNISPNWNVYGLPNTVWTVHYDTIYARRDTAGCFSATGSATIASSHTGTGYLWYDGVTTATHTITSAGIYWVAVHNACNVVMDTIVVHAATIPPPPTITGDTIYCYGDPYTPLSAIGSNILWYTSPSSTTGTLSPPVVNTFSPGIYTFYATQTIDCVSPKQSVTITVLPKITPNFTYQIRRGCISDTVIFTNTSTNADYYSWNFGDHAHLDTSSISTTHIYSAHGVYSVTLTGRTTEGCIADTTIIIDTHYPNNAGFTIMPDTLCKGGSSTFTMNVPATALLNYLWKFGDGDTTAFTLMPNHQYTVEGVYPVTLSILDTAGCVDSLTKYVYVFGVRINIFHDTTLCVSMPFGLQNEVKVLPFPLSGTMSFHWSPAIHLSDTTAQIPFYRGLGTTTYTFTATANPLGCIEKDTVRVNSILGKPLTRVSRDTTITLGHSAQLNSWNELIYRWEPNDGTLNNPNINNPIATPTSTTQYIVYGYDENGCQDSAFVTVYVDSDMEECIPTAFTPNGDGLNDVFRPLCLRLQKIVEFNVYNRWGELVFTSASADKGWDGTYKGIAQEIGTYYYMITIARANAQNVLYKGDVTLIR